MKLGMKNRLKIRHYVYQAALPELANPGVEKEPSLADLIKQ